MNSYEESVLAAIIIATFPENTKRKKGRKDRNGSNLRFNKDNIFQRYFTS